jgi:hypothetical protein
VAELVDARDLKSLGPRGCTGSIPVPGTKKNNKEKGLKDFTGFKSLFFFVALIKYTPITEHGGLEIVLPGEFA